MGKSIYLLRKGADGVIDISPFSCMNGIVCEVVYPQVSQDFDHFPIRIFYFDGTQIDLNRDVGIYGVGSKLSTEEKGTAAVSVLF